jgi:glycosyltransferase involved in cell wall biosynthesis
MQSHFQGIRVSVEVLHVIQQFGRGGASQALISLIDVETSSRHRVVSLIPAVPSARYHLVEKGIPLFENPPQLELESLVESADIVQIHFWNTPELYEFMSRPITARLILWSHVAGKTAPHIVTPELASYSDLIISTGLPFDNLCDRGLVIKPRTPHNITQSPRPTEKTEPFTVGIFGTLDSSRSEASAFDVFIAAKLPGAKLLVVGNGNLLPIWRAQAESLNMLDRIEFTGFVNDVGSQLSRMDILLHMPRKDSFATSDLALQEALLAGVVPVVTSGTPVTDLVRHGFDALIALDADECALHLRALFQQPALLARLREEGLRRSHAEFHPQSTTREFENLYRQLMDQPVRTHQLSIDLADTGAQRFIATLGFVADTFKVSATRGNGWQEADEIISLSSPALIGAGAGGILHYRGYYPHDPMLRYWAGLVFANQGRTAFAAAEFSAAVKADVLGAEERLNALLDSSHEFKGQ